MCFVDQWGALRNYRGLDVGKYRSFQWVIGPTLL